MNSNSNLKLKYESEQYEYANELIRIKLKHRLNQMEMAKLCEKNYDYYLALESTDINTSVKEYKNVIEIIKNKLGENSN